MDSKTQILEALTQLGGFLPLTSQSNEEQIINVIGLQKAEFLQALDELENKSLIVVMRDGIQHKPVPNLNGRMFRQVRKKR